MRVTDPRFEALKDLTRLNWMLNFEAIGTVANDEDSLTWRSAPLPAR